MSVKMFAAIDVGSYEIAIKVFELSPKFGVKQLDYVRHRIELGTDTFHTGKISYERMEELCNVLNGFRRIMETYQVTEYKAFATSAIRETENTRIILDQIKLKTGLTVEVLSNSEQRFINYKSVAVDAERFEKLIQRGTAFLDIGGGSIQVSLFENSKLIVSQNLNLGILRIREQLSALQPKTIHYEQLVEELIDNEMHVFRKMYLKDIKIENIIVVDDYISYILNKIGSGINVNMVTGEEYVRFVDVMKSKSPDQFAKAVGVPQENSTLLLPSAILIKHFVESTGASLLWMPGVSLSDGIAFDYAQKQKIIKGGHDFEQDILSSAQTISKRFRGSKSRGNSTESVALAVFDAMKKIHGLSRRERLLLQLCSILRDCGKYVNAYAPAECSYNIITHTEIMGISQMEREIIAQTVRNSFSKFIYWEELSGNGSLDEKGYLVVAKLTAILQIAAGLARSQKKIFENVKATLKEQELVITVDTVKDLTLEQGLFAERTSFFEEVFGMRPIVKKKVKK